MRALGAELDEASGAARSNSRRQASTRQGKAGVCTLGDEDVPHSATAADRVDLTEEVRGRSDAQGSNVAEPQGLVTGCVASRAEGAVVS
jgi:hypothetical protein